MLKPISVAVGLFFTLSPAIAQSVLDGLWAEEGESCSFGNTDNVPMEIVGNEIRLYETACRLSNPVNIRGMNGQLVDMNCSGEGYTWSNRGLFLLNGDGSLTVSREDQTRVYFRCE